MRVSLFVKPGTPCCVSKEYGVKRRSHDRARKILIFWTLFIGIGAAAGAAAMLADPSGGIMGMDAMLPYFQKLPFADVLFQDFLFCQRQ